MTGEDSYHTTPNSSGVEAGSSTPQYNMRLNPPYLVDFTSVLSGKRVAATKRRVRFRFGFSNAEALAAGKTGIECRGCEHDVTLVWSHTSGKRLVVADGREVHFSVGKPTQGKFQFTWTMRGGHTLKLIAHAAPPLQQPRPGWKQFDLQLDGLSVFEFPRIYELGVKAGGDRRALVTREAPRGENGRASYSNYAMPSDEQVAWARNVERYEERRSIDRVASPDLATPATSSPPREDRGFAQSPPSSQLQQYDSPDYASPPSSVTVPAPAPSLVDLVSDGLAYEGQDLIAEPNVSAMGDYGAHGQDEFAPQPVTPPPPPSYRDLTSSIMAGYGGGAGTGPAPSPPNGQGQQLPALPPSTTYEGQQQPPPPQQQGYYQQTRAAQPSYEQQAYYQQPPPQMTYEQQSYYQQPPPQHIYEQQQRYQQHAPPSVQTLRYDQQQYQPYSQQEGKTIMPQFSPTGVEAIDNVPFNQESEDDGDTAKKVDEITRSMKTLVNLEDIMAAPEESLDNMREALRTNPFAQKNVPQSKLDKAAKSAKPKSKGAPPAGQGWALQGKSIAEVQAITREHKPAQPSKEVMRGSAYDPASAGQHGMMVVYGPQPGQGPPPLGIHESRGFGVGATMQNGGYAVYTQ